MPVTIVETPLQPALRTQPLLFRGGSRAQVMRLVGELCTRLASWVERDHYDSVDAPRERARMGDLVRLLRAAAATAQER